MPKFLHHVSYVCLLLVLHKDVGRLRLQRLLLVRQLLVLLQLPWLLVRGLVMVEEVVEVEEVAMEPVVAKVAAMGCNKGKCDQILP